MLEYMCWWSHEDRVCVVEPRLNQLAWDCW
jgi:hypothetical protein